MMVIVVFQFLLSQVQMLIRMGDSRFVVDDLGAYGAYSCKKSYLAWADTLAKIRPWWKGGEPFLYHSLFSLGYID